MIEQLFDGLMLALDWQVLLAILLGSIGGIIVGALPGLSSTLGVALLIPFTFGLSAPVAFGLLGGMYCSSIYGGSITAILINTPGTGAAAATVLDGYPMTQKGQAGKALATAIWSSFLAVCFPPRHFWSWRLRCRRLLYALALRKHLRYVCLV